MVEYEAPECVMCDGPTMLLGQLGVLFHYRCRNCGMIMMIHKERLNETIRSNVADT